MTATTALTLAQTDELRRLFGVEDGMDNVVLLVLARRLVEHQDELHRLRFDVAWSAALAARRVDPTEREKWRQAFFEDPEAVIEMLDHRWTD